MILKKQSYIRWLIPLLNTLQCLLIPLREQAKVLAVADRPYLPELRKPSQVPEPSRVSPPNSRGSSHTSLLSAPSSHGHSFPRAFAPLSLSLGTSPEDILVDKCLDLVGSFLNVPFQGGPSWTSLFNVAPFPRAPRALSTDEMFP